MDLTLTDSMLPALNALERILAHGQAEIKDTSLASQEVGR
jgi:hypothetical protein